MTVGSKAGILLVLTFVLGAVVGALGYGAVNDERQHMPHRPPPGLDNPGGRPGGPGGGPNQPPGLGGRGGRGDGGGPDGRGGPPPSFVDRTLDLIQPRDSAQASALRPFLEETDRHNRAIVDSARGQMHAELHTLRGHIASLLDGEQLRRFDDFAKR